uniref:hypothetical protein n=1 Tax=Roseivirga sp. TaxID=1964215 RepID=UPI0040477CD9
MIRENKKKFSLLLIASFLLLLFFGISNDAVARAGNAKAKAVITYDANNIPHLDCTTCDPDGSCTVTSCTPPEQ